MKENLLHIVAEFRKLERKRKAMGDEFPPKDAERHAHLKQYLEKTLHGIEPGHDRRNDLRVPVSMRVRYASGDVFAHNYISNLSSGGVFISTNKPLPLDTKVKLFLVFEDEKTEVEIEGKVVWENTQGGRRDDITRPGMGIKFLKINPEAQEIINDLIHDTLEERAKLAQERRELGEQKKKNRESENSVFGIFGRKKK